MWTRCVKSDVVETRYGYQIAKEVDKKINPDTDETYGHGKVFYAVYGDDGNGDIMMFESFKTVTEARRFIDRLL